MTIERVDIYLHSSKESNYENGAELGLTGDALNMFAYAAYEVRLTLEVDTSTGEAHIVEVDGRPLAAAERA